MPGLKLYLSRHSKALGVGGSLLLHVLVVALLVMPSSAPLSGLGDGNVGELQEVEGIDIYLLQSADRPKTPANIASNFTPMLQNITDDGWKPAGTPQRTQLLSDLFGESKAEADYQQSQARPKTDHEGHVKVNGRESQTMNDLWRAIEPCWNRLADRNTQEVTLTVSFSPLGNLAKSPSIVRAPGTKLTDQVLRSELLAKDALAQCGPYLMAFGQSDVQVWFPAGT